MIHEHHQWLADVNDSIVESYEREQEMAGKPERIQELASIFRAGPGWAGWSRCWPACGLIVPAGCDGLAGVAPVGRAFLRPVGSFVWSGRGFFG